MPMPTVRRMKAKLALMGEGGVGKTSLIRRFVLNEYQDTYLHTVGTRVSKVELTVRHGAEAFAAPIVYVSARTGALVDDAFNALAIEMVDRAFRQDAARAVERGLRDKVLLLLDKRGSIGLKKNQLFEILRGVNFDDLQSELGRLEGEGLVTLLWHGASDFTAVVTPRGTAATQRGYA